jgi:hypothetical protein
LYCSGIVTSYQNIYCTSPAFKTHSYEYTTQQDYSFRKRYYRSQAFLPGAFWFYAGRRNRKFMGGAAYFPENGEPFKAESNTKIVFEVAEGLPALRESLLQKGVLLHDIKSFEPSLSLYCDGEDIEGNVFQLAQTKR